MMPPRRHPHRAYRGHRLREAWYRRAPGAKIPAKQAGAAIAAAIFVGRNLPIGIIRDIRRGRVSKIVALLHPGCHQGPNKTSLDRYPEIFAAAAAALPNAQNVLSFGCSTGEECVTLANYFPGAMIVGADINPLNLLKARKHRSDRIRFVYASGRILSSFGGFDAVFCMAVLRTPKRKKIAEHYPFARFEERALFLESLVKPGGLLVIHNATYRFSDTEHRGVYESIPVREPHDKVYLPDGIIEAKPDSCILRKLEPQAAQG
jgi:Methyltransferase domain